MRALVAIAALLVAACSDRSPLRAQPIDPRIYVPTTPGDRFRDRVEPGDRYEHYGITARDSRGRAILLGTDRPSMSLLDSREDGVWIVSPDGRRLIPVIVAPIVRGHSIRYRVAVDQGRAGDCELRMNAVDRNATVAGRRFESCVDQTRRCVYPASDRLARPTTITEEETLCPKVGRVLLRFTADPPLPFGGLPSSQTSTLVSFHVAGGVSIDPTTRLSDRLIVLPSDVGAVCGAMPIATELRASATAPIEGGPLGSTTPQDAEAGDVLLGFAMPDGALTIEARNASTSSLERYLESSDGTRRVGFAADSTVVRITPNPSCRDASRFEPLLRSMLD